MVAAVRLKQRLSGHVESQDEIAVPPAPINALLSGLLAIEAAALRVVNMPLGSSLLAVAHEAAKAHGVHGLITRAVTVRTIESAGESAGTVDPTCANQVTCEATQSSSMR